MIRIGVALALIAGHSLPARAETDFQRLTASERAAFHAEIRAALLDVPQLLPNAPVPTPLQDEIAGDLARIQAHSDRLFDPAYVSFGRSTARVPIALFITPTCGAKCDRAVSDLRALAHTHDIRVTLINVKETPNLVQALGIDTTPFYVFPDKFLRGQMPLVVLQRYVTE